MGRTRPQATTAEVRIRAEESASSSGPSRGEPRFGLADVVTDVVTVSLLASSSSINFSEIGTKLHEVHGFYAPVPFHTTLEKKGELGRPEDSGLAW